MIDTAADEEFADRYLEHMAECVTCWEFFNDKQGAYPIHIAAKESKCRTAEILCGEYIVSRK